MTPDLADALGAFRQFNYETIYHREESRKQARDVIDMLRTLVDHYIASPHLIPPDENGVGDVQHAVTYVGGMTDRFACKQALLFGYPEHKLPRAI
jgi:dGTPase